MDRFHFRATLRRWRRRMITWWWAFAALCAVVAQCASADDAPQFAVPVARGATTPVIGTLRVTLALFVVLGVVLAAAWFTRRLRGAGSAAAGSLQVLAQVPLGTRERVVLLRVGARQLLVGVAPGSVRTLHVLDGDAIPAEPEGAPDTEPGRPTFRSVLMRSLGR